MREQDAGGESQGRMTGKKQVWRTMQTDTAMDTGITVMNGDTVTIKVADGDVETGTVTDGVTDTEMYGVTDTDADMVMETYSVTGMMTVTDTGTDGDGEADCKE